MKKAIHLHGAAGRFFGKRFDLEVETPRDAIRALISRIKGFGEFLEKGNWRVIRGRSGINVEEIGMTFGRSNELHLVPAARGAKRGGVGKIIVGVVIVIAALVTAYPSGGTSIGAALAADSALGVSYGSIALFGASMILAGTAQLLTSAPSSLGSAAQREDPASRPSFLFNGPVNVVQEGEPIPLVYGKRVRVGSVVASAGIFTEQMEA
jgi:predicted phage tail protein